MFDVVVKESRLRYKENLKCSDIGRSWTPCIYNSKKFEDRADIDAYRTQSFKVHRPSAKRNNSLFALYYKLSFFPSTVMCFFFSYHDIGSLQFL
jgi:hypothetical protein